MRDGIFEYTDLTEDQVIKTQVCVIGSGCGGATVAKKLTDAGVEVVLLERGGYHPAGDMDQDELNMPGKIASNRNFEANHDGSTVLVGGYNIGGASVHYWADSYRTPQFKLDEWRDEYGLEGHHSEDLDPVFDEIEQELHIHRAKDESFNNMNKLFKKTAEKLDWHGHRVPQARKYCMKSGHCVQGCMYNAKQSQMITHIPKAIAQGAKVYADAQAGKFIFDGDKVTSLTVDVIDRKTNRPSGVKMIVQADQFVVAAGGFNSSYFLMQQGLQEKLPQLGKNFSFNPSIMTYGLYDENITMWRNIPAAYGVDKYLQRTMNGDEYKEGGYLLMPNQVQPAFLAATLPGIGKSHGELMQQMPNIGGTAAWMDDIPGELGEIQMNDDGSKKVFYEYGPLTRKILKDAIHKQIEFQFAAGAKKVVVGSNESIVLESMDDLHKVDKINIAPGEIFIGAPHPGGGCRMGKDTTDSVVGYDHKVHGLENVYVSDSSVFPTSSAVDPSVSIMAFSHIAAKHIISARKKSA